MPSGPVSGRPVVPAAGFPKSSISGIPWPAVPHPSAAVLLGMLHELETTQWLPPAELARRQSVALGALVAHARSTVPFYRDDPAYAGARSWDELPILTRQQIQAAGPALVSTAVPADHLPLADMTTSGTTGPPLTVKATRITGLFWLVCTLREHQWHGRDHTTKVATLRPDPSGRFPVEGGVYPSWGAPIDTVFDTGPCAVMAVQQDVAAQAEFLVAQDPTYLLGLPSNLTALAEHFARTGARLPSLREVRTYGEVVDPELRDACRRVWGVPVIDMYSCQELGYLALQCPTAERYHVMSEVAVVEVLDEDGRQCRPGETGRVVVTQLHNYAMPLLRYDLGDHAQVGEPCSCGRGLPVLDRIVGRRRNLPRLPAGEVSPPTFGSAERKAPVDLASEGRAPAVPVLRRAVAGGPRRLQRPGPLHPRPAAGVGVVAAGGDGRPPAGRARPPARPRPPHRALLPGRPRLRRRHPLVRAADPHPGRGAGRRPPPAQRGHPRRPPARVRSVVLGIDRAAADGADHPGLGAALHGGDAARPPVAPARPVRHHRRDPGLRVVRRSPTRGCPP